MNDKENKNLNKYNRNSYNSFNMPKNTIVSNINTDNSLIPTKYEEIDNDFSEEKNELQNDISTENIENQSLENNGELEKTNINSIIHSANEKIANAKLKIDKTKNTIKFILKYKWIFITLISFFLILFLILFVLDPNMDNILSLTGWNKDIHDNTRTVQYTTDEINSLMIYIGDEELKNITSGVKTITSPSPTYNWLVSTAKSELDSIISSYKFVVFKITNNDLNNANNYINIFNSIKASHPDLTFYYVGNNDQSFSVFNTNLKNGIGDSFISLANYTDIDDFHNDVLNYIQDHNLKTISLVNGDDGVAVEACGNSPSHHFIYYNQKNYQDSYGFGTTIASSGCGPTAMAMVLSYYLDRSITPVETANYSLNHGHRIDNVSGTLGTFFPDIASNYEIKGYQIALTREGIINSLEVCHLVIVSMKCCTFTTGGHYIVLVGTDGENVIVADPNSVEKTNQPFSINTILNEGGAVWAFSN